MKAKDKRLKRRSRLERQRAFMVKFWGTDWQQKRAAFAAKLTIKPGMSRILKRHIITARAFVATALLLACATPSQQNPETAELRDRLMAVEKRLENAEQRMLDQDRSIDDTRSLCLIGGPRRRYDAGVKCSIGRIRDSERSA